MYPYAPGPYGPRPDANMMAAYRQQQQLYQQQQQQRPGAPWSNNSGVYPGMEHNSNMQGMGYPGYAGQMYPPNMGYPMQQHHHQQQPYGQFNAPQNRQTNDYGNGGLPQRPGWAESRPGRTPCKEDWWSHVKEEMQCIDSPRGIDLEKEDEHANVMEELQRTGTTSGVVNDGEDTAAAFDEARGNGGDGAAATAVVGGIVDGPFATAPPTTNTTTATMAITPDHRNAAAMRINATSASYGAQVGASTSPSQEEPPRRPAAAKKARQENGEGRPSSSAHRRSSQTEEGEEGKKKRGHKGKSHRRHSAKEGGSEPPRNANEHRASTSGGSDGLGDSAFIPTGAFAPGSPPSAAAAATKDPNGTRLAPTPQRPFMERGDGQHGKAAGMTPMPLGIDNRMGPASSPSTGVLGKEHTMPPRLPPLHQDEQPRAGQAARNAESMTFGGSMIQHGQGRPSVFDESNAAEAAAAAAAAAAKRNSATVGGPGYSMNGASHNRLSTSESAVDSGEMAKILAGQRGSTTSPAKAHNRNQRLYSYFSSRRPTTLGEGEEGEADDERNSAAAYGSGSDEEEEDESGSEESEDDSDEGSESDDDEVEYSTMHRTPDHANHPGRSMLEYSAFRDMPSAAGLRNEGGSRSDFAAALGEAPPPGTQPGNRKSIGGYGLGSFSGSGPGEMPSHRARPSHPNASITMQSTSAGLDDRAYMMIDMSLMERTTGLSGIPTASGRSSTQPQHYGRPYSTSAPREDSQPYAVGKLGTPQHPPQHPQQQTHTLLKETNEAAPAGKERRGGEGDKVESAAERTQRVGGGRRIPPKITTRQSIGANMNNNNSSAPQTAVSLPSVQPKPSPDANAASAPASAATAAATAASGGVNAPSKAERPEARLPPARAADKRPLPAVMGANRAAIPADDRKGAKTGAGKDGTPTGRPPVSTATASAAATTATTTATATTSATAAAAMAATATTAAPRKPAGSPAMNNAVEMSRLTSGASSSKPTPLTSGAGRGPSVLQRLRKASGTGAAAEKASTSPGNRSLSVAAPQSKVPSPAASAASLSDRRPPMESRSVASPNNSLDGKTPAYAKAAMGSGKALSIMRQASPSSAASPNESALRPQASTALAATTASSTLGSFKRTSSGLATPPSTNHFGMDSIPAAAHPPLGFTFKSSVPSTSTAAGGVARPTKPPAHPSENVTSEQQQHQQKGSGVNSGTTPTAPRVGAGQGASANPLQLSPNPLSLASSTSTGLANSSMKKEADGRDTSPEATGSKAVATHAPHNARESPRTVPSPSTRTVASPSPSTAALGSGRKAPMQPSAVAAASENTSNAKVTLMPGKRTVGGASPTTASLASSSSRPVDAVSGNNIPRRPAPTASASARVCSPSAVSSPQSDEGSSGASAVQLSTTQRMFARQPGGPCPPTDPFAATSRPTPPSAATAASAGGRPNPKEQDDADDDTRDAWMAEAYDFYAYSGRSLSDDEAEMMMAPSAAAAGERNTASPTAAQRGGAKRLSVTTTTGSLTDLGYIMF